MVEAPRSAVPLHVTIPLPARLMMPRPARLVVLIVTVNFPLWAGPEKIPVKLEVLAPPVPGLVGLLLSLQPARAIRPRVRATESARIRLGIRKIPRAPFMKPPVSYETGGFMNGARGILRIPNLILALSVALTLGLIALAGCSDSNNPTNPGTGGASTSSFTGIFSGPAQSGKLTVTINTTSLAGRGIIKRAGRGIVTCSGTADFGASTINIAGTYDTSIDGFTLTGGGYTFDGTYQIAQGKPTLQGFWDGPGG